MKTIEQVLQLFPETTASDWQQHSNGGGWVQNTATVDAIEEMEKRVAQNVGEPVLTFFSNNKSPERFSTCRCHNTGKPLLTAKDVKRWALDDDLYNPSLPFEDEEEDSYGCFSVYGLCDTSVDAVEERGEVNAKLTNEQDNDDE